MLMLHTSYIVMTNEEVFRVIGGDNITQ